MVLENLLCFLLQGVFSWSLLKPQMLIIKGLLYQIKILERAYFKFICFCFSQEKK